MPVCAAHDQAALFIDEWGAARCLRCLDESEAMPC
jgi:hypothetical protein